MAHIQACASKSGSKITENNLLIATKRSLLLSTMLLSLSMVNWIPKCLGKLKVGFIKSYSSNIDRIIHTNLAFYSLNKYWLVHEYHLVSEEWCTFAVWPSVNCLLRINVLSYTLYMCNSICIIECLDSDLELPHQHQWASNPSLKCFLKWFMDNFHIYNCLSSQFVLSNDHVVAYVNVILRYTV